MPLHTIPVVVPYRLEDDPESTLYGVGVQAVGTTPQAGQAVAQILVKSTLGLRHPGRIGKLIADRVKVGELGATVDGPYAYVLTTGNHINFLSFPQRIDQDRGYVLDQMLAGLDEKQVLGVLMDCVHLTYINSSGLGALASQATRLNMRLFRMSDPVAKVFEITGLTRAVPAYPDLPSALNALVRHAGESRV